MIGGKNMINFNIPPYVGKEKEYVTKAIDNKKICGDGEFTKKCNEWFFNKINSNVLLTTSGTDSLEMAAILAGIEQGDEVIMPSYTFSSTANAFILRGAKIVFVDIRPDTMNIDEKLIEEAITSKTKAIVPVHYAGVSCEMDKIMKIAKKYNLKVIYDAAHAFGVKKNGADVASFGDMVMFSCHATKVFHTIEGGIAVFKEKAPYQVINSLVNFGFDGPEEVRYISTNARMNEYEAAMGICNLRHIEDELLKRKVAYDRYVELLSDI